MAKILPFAPPKTRLGGSQRATALFLWRNGVHQIDDTWKRLDTKEIAVALGIEEESMVYNTIAHANGDCEWQHEDDENLR